jgi:UDP-GlcNAc:undecaprenyl-phosphate/decaprenyl-phosphate GlcNAc-1-phosphate transferase
MTILIIILVLALSATVSAIGNSLALNFAKTLGIRNKNNITIRWSNESKPSLGGVSMFIVFVLGGFVITLVLNEELQLIKMEYLGLLLATSIAFAMGFSDDAYDTKPWFKLFVQLLCGLIFVVSGSAIDLFHQSILDGMVTILLVVILMNSLNMLDNMDGISGTVTFFVLAACFIVIFFSSSFVLTIWSLLLLVCAGTMLGFLIYNIHPSKLFMGDAGSQFIGVIVSFFTIHSLFQVHETIGVSSWLGPCLALVALTPAAADTLTVVINRIRAGKSPMVGGKDHTTHYLVYSGKNDRKVWQVFLALSFISAGITVFLFLFAAQFLLFSAVIGIAYFLLVFLFLFRNTIKYQQKV